MRLTLDSILYKLKNLNPNSIKNNLVNSSFEGIKLYDPTNHDLLSEFIYVANISQIIESLPELESNLTYFCVDDIEVDEVCIRKHHVNLVLFKKAYPLAFIFNLILDIFSEFKQWDKTMHLSVLEGTEIQKLIDQTYDLLEYPLILFDPSFNVIAYTKSRSTEDPLYHKTINIGYSASHIIETLKKEKLFNRLHESDEPIYYRAIGSPVEQNIYFKVKNHETVYAYGCIFYGKEKPDNGYIDIVRIFLENLRLHFDCNDDKKRFGGFSYEKFFIGLFNSKEIIEEQVKEQIQYIDDLTYNGTFMLAKLRFDKLNNAPLRFILKEIKNNLCNIKPFVHNDELYFLKIFSGGLNISQTKLTDIERKTLHKICSLYDYKCALSNFFYSISGIGTASIQCQEALYFGGKLTLKSNRVYDYQNYYLYHMFKVMENEVSLNAIQIPKFKVLTAFDCKNQTAYCDLLYTFLKYQQNTTEVSIHLHMHRNTIINRLNRIKKLIDFDFENFQENIDFILSYEMENYRQKIGFHDQKDE